MRHIIIGLDGVPFPLISDLSGKGIIPNIEGLIRTGTFRHMKSSIPEISSVAWSSMITGTNPAEHGIFGFTDFLDDSYGFRFPNYTALQAEPFWNRTDKRSVIINVPSTFPVKEMNGVHISGFVSLDLARSVYPEGLLPRLEEFNYRVDVDSGKAHESIGLFLQDLDETLDARIQAYSYLWENEDWEIFMLVFTGTDRLMHFLWDAYEDEGHTHHQAFCDHFSRVDAEIGNIISNMSPEDTLIIISDHGFESIEAQVYVNFLLREEGFLSFDGEIGPNLNNVSQDSKAFALDPGRIYINAKDRFPRGSVGKDDRKAVLDDIEALFAGLEVNGKQAVRSVFRREDVYSGPLCDKAPDCILMGNPGFDLKGRVNASSLSSREIFTGKHTYDTAFFIANENIPESAIPDDIRVQDVRSIIGL